MGIRDEMKDEIEGMQGLIEDFANLFGDAEDMSEMDAADFKDNAGKIWELRQRAKEIVKQQQGF